VERRANHRGPVEPLLAVHHDVLPLAQSQSDSGQGTPELARPDLVTRLAPINKNPLACRRIRVIEVDTLISAPHDAPHVLPVSAPPAWRLHLPLVADDERAGPNPHAQRRVELGRWLRAPWHRAPQLACRRNGCGATKS
jgi:hypothetical protein